MKQRRDCAVILLYDKGKILLQHRADDVKRFPGKWGFFGGGIEEGETPEEAVKRETKEELEYVLRNPKHFMTQQFETEENFGEKHVFLEKYDGSPLTLLEGKDKGWFTQVKNVRMPYLLVVLFLSSFLTQ
tara:strand:+ start:81 stop:470 length:390 start_codon:yes stop_codon:yes gene_type:complete